MTQTSPSSDRRRLGLPSATALVVASMIGVGVFTTSGFSLQALGTPERVLAAWATAALIAMLGAISYGSLAARISESGGEYLFLTHTVHPFAGFLAGWVSLLAGFTAPIAVAAAGFQAYLPFELPAGVSPNLVGTMAIVVAGVLHGLNLVGGVRIQNAVVAIKVALLVGLVVYGVPRLPAQLPSLEAEAFSISAFSVSLVWISLSYSGWNAAVYIGGEVRDPKRTLPRALVLGTLAVTVLYLLLNALFVYAAPVGELAGKADVAAVAARAIGGVGLEQFVRVVVCIALLTSISAMVMAGPRVYARMADDGVFPRCFSASGAAPAFAIVLQVVLAVIVLWVSTLSDLLGYIGWTLSFSTAITVIGLMRLRVREGRESVPIPGWPWVPALFCLATLGAGGFMIAQSAAPLVGLATIASGAVLYGAVRIVRGRRR